VGEAIRIHIRANPVIERRASDVGRGAPQQVGPPGPRRAGRVGPIDRASPDHLQAAKDLAEALYGFVANAEPEDVTKGPGRAGVSAHPAAQPKPFAPGRRGRILAYNGLPIQQSLPE
jgi:hypothetical protein